MSVDSRGRIRLTKEIAEAILWLSRENETACVAFIGVHGQLQIAPEALARIVGDKLTAALRETPARVDEANDEWTEFARYAASRWPMTISRDPNRARWELVLPSEVRAIGVVEAETFAVLFVCGNIFEVWKKEEWAAHAKLLRAKFDHLTEVAEDEIANRTS